MAQSIQRLRYFDGEYLRSNDFTDEQSYHVAMRRRLNLALHLSGIAYGLEIQQDANSVLPNGPFFFSITTGFAIDQLGREIVVSAPYELSSDNVLSRAGLRTGLNEVWIVYTETATGLPAPGYQLCDQPGQNTRWTESFDVRLRLKGAPPSTTGDDPNTDLKGVLLGHVTVTNDPVNGWMITNTPSPDTLGRTYVGIRAQSIVAPDQLDGDTSTFTDQNITPPVASAVAPLGYLDVGGGPAAGPPGAPGVLIRGNTYCARNLVVGDDYLIQNTNPPPLSLTNPNGNLKLNSDLFLNGQIYKDVAGNWLALSSYIKTLVPDVQFSTALVHFDFSGALPVPTSPQTVTVSTTLPTFTTADPQASIAAFQFVSQSGMNTYINLGPPIVHPSLSVSAAYIGAASATAANIQVSCFVGGGYPPTNTPATQTALFQSVDVALVVVFRP